MRQFGAISPVNSEATQISPSSFDSFHCSAVSGFLCNFVDQWTRFQNFKSRGKKVEREKKTTTRNHPVDDMYDVRSVRCLFRIHPRAYTQTRDATNDRLLCFAHQRARSNVYDRAEQRGKNALALHPKGHTAHTHTNTHTYIHARTHQRRIQTSIKNKKTEQKYAKHTCKQGKRGIRHAASE